LGEKLKIYDVGEKTTFTQLPLHRKEQNQFWARDPLRQLWVKNTVKSEKRISRVDTLFGRVLSPSNKDVIYVSGKFYPVDFDNPCVTCEKAELRLTTHNGVFDGYIFAPIKQTGIPEKKVYLLDYYLDDNMFIRGWYRPSNISASTVSFDLIKQETLDDKKITVGWSDRVN